MGVAVATNGLSESRGSAGATYICRVECDSFSVATCSGVKEKGLEFERRS